LRPRREGAGAAHGGAAARPRHPSLAVRCGRRAGGGHLSRPARPGAARGPRTRPPSSPELAPRAGRSARQASAIVIARLSGTLAEKQVQRLIVDVQGVGYDVLVPLSTFYSLGEPGSPVTLRIYTHVRE